MERAWKDMAELGVDAVVPMTHQVGKGKGRSAAEQAPLGFTQAGVRSFRGDPSALLWVLQDMVDDVRMASRWGPEGSEWEKRQAEGPTPPLGVILGGHDHEIMYEVPGGCQIIKVGLGFSPPPPPPSLSQSLSLSLSLSLCVSLSLPLSPLSLALPILSINRGRRGPWQSPGTEPHLPAGLRCNWHKAH